MTTRDDVTGSPAAYPTSAMAADAESEAARPAWGWLLQALTGVLLLALLTLHMIANHFVVKQGLRDFHDVVVYLSNPVILPLEVLFLFAATWHGLLGLRAIIFDFGFSQATERRITYVLTAVGAIAIVYGLWLTWTIVTYKV